MLVLNLIQMGLKGPPVNITKLLQEPHNGSLGAPLILKNEPWVNEIELQGCITGTGVTFV